MGPDKEVWQPLRKNRYQRLFGLLPDGLKRALQDLLELELLLKPEEIVARFLALYPELFYKIQDRFEQQVSLDVSYSAAAEALIQTAISKHRDSFWSTQLLMLEHKRGVQERNSFIFQALFTHGSLVTIELNAIPNSSGERQFKSHLLFQPHVRNFNNFVAHLYDWTLQKMQQKKYPRYDFSPEEIFEEMEPLLEELLEVMLSVEFIAQEFEAWMLMVGDQEEKSVKVAE